MQLREALVEAELDDPVVLKHRAYAYEQALGTGDVVGDTFAHVCESPTASDVLIGPIGGMATIGTSTISTGIVGTRISSVGTGSSARRARGKRAKAAQPASVSSSVLVVSLLVSDSGVGSVKDALSLAVEEKSLWNLGSGRCIS